MTPTPVAFAVAGFLAGCLCMRATRCMALNYTWGAYQRSQDNLAATLQELDETAARLREAHAREDGLAGLLRQAVADRDACWDDYDRLLTDPAAYREEREAYCDVMALIGAEELGPVAPLGVVPNNPRDN